MVEQLKERFIKNNVQTIVADVDLNVRSSDNNLMYLKNGLHLPDYHPFFYSLGAVFDGGGSETFYCVQFESLGKKRFYDIKCSLDRAENVIAIFILDLTDHYSKMHGIKQVRNESVIEFNVVQELNAQLELQRGFKNRFIANVSHEIRTPLNAILGFLDILQNTSLDRQQIDLVNIIKGSASNLTGIVNDLLDISKIEAGRLEINNKRFYFRHFVEELAKTYRLRAEEKRLDFNLELDEKVPKFLVADELRLRQVMINLLENAFKYTHVGSITLRISTPSRNARRIPLTIEVIDTGIGIAAEDQDKIFDSFAQIEKEGLFGGVGLGLSIVSQLVELMDSKIMVESERDKGSNFSFTVSLGVSHDQSSGSRKSRNAIYKKLEKKRYRILLAEDIEVNQLLMMRLFAERREFSLDLAKNGERVLELIEKYPYDLILMDLTMPTMDGIDTAMRIRGHQDKKISKIPIIAVTARATQEDIDESMEAGMNDYITKPIDPERLFLAINKQLTKYKRTKKEA